MTLWDQWVAICASVKSAIVVWIVFMSLLVFATYTVLRIHVTYELQQDFALIKAAHVQMLEQMKMRDDEAEMRLRYLEQTVYGEIQPKQQQLTKDNPQLLRPSRIELYQQNTNKELRQRLERLENWRVRIENERDDR